MTKYLVPSSKPNAPHRAEMLIKKSRFIVSMAHTASADEAKLFIERIRNEFPDATHNCWAFAAGKPGDTACVGSSDDGEPHGTAGRPMLTLLTYGNIGEITAVVTRYFGGIKLGTGGLVRAYQDMIRLGLEALPVCEHINSTSVQIVVRYADIDRLMRLLPRHRATVMHEHFDTSANYKITLPEENLQNLAEELNYITDGTAVLTHI